MHIKYIEKNFQKVLTNSNHSYILQSRTNPNKKEGDVLGET